MTKARLALTPDQILARRRQVGALDERLEPGAATLRRAAWAGLQDTHTLFQGPEAWRRLSGTERAAMEVEAASLPLPGTEGPFRVGP